jgi:hypothetical protein
MIITILSALARLLGPILPSLAGWIAGRRDARLVAQNAAAEGYIKTREAIDNVQDIIDPDLARQRLRDRDPKQP